MGPVQTSDPHIADVTKVGQYKRRTYTFRTGTNVGPTHIGRYKGRTVQTTDLHTSDWYKRRTHTHRTLQRSDSTNHGLTHFGQVQTSDWNKRRTETNVGPVQTSDRYINNE